MTEFISKSVKDTENFGERVARALPSPGVIALYGDLGSGKTAFTRGFVRGLGLVAEVHSPTFTFCNDYSDEKVGVYHFDMYRISSEDDLYSIGFYDYLEEGAYIIIEWSENIDELLPSDSIKIKITKNENENDRIFKMNGCDLAL